jgi:hypothetical protein
MPRVFQEVEDQEGLYPWLSRIYIVEDQIKEGHHALQECCHVKPANCTVNQYNVPVAELGNMVYFSAIFGVLLLCATSVLGAPGSYAGCEFNSSIIRERLVH